MAQVWAWLPCNLSRFLSNSLVWVRQLSWLKQFKVLQNYVMYQRKYCWRQIFSTTKTSSHKEITISHVNVPKHSIEISCNGPPRPSPISIPILNCNWTLLKLKLKSTEINKIPEKNMTITHPRISKKNSRRNKLQWPVSILFGFTFYIKTAIKL